MVDRRQGKIQTVIEAEDVGIALKIDNSWMVPSRTGVVVHNVALIDPGPRWLVTHGVTDALGTAGGCVGQVIFSAPLIEPRAFLIIRRLGLDLGDLPRIGRHVLVQLDVPDARITPIKISLAVVIDEHSRIKKAFRRTNQRLA